MCTNEVLQSLNKRILAKECTSQWIQAKGPNEMLVYLTDKKHKLADLPGYALKWAAANGFLDIVKYLLTSHHYSYDDKVCAVRWAVLNDHCDTYRYILTFMGPKSRSAFPLMEKTEEYLEFVSKWDMSKICALNDLNVANYVNPLGEYLITRSDFVCGIIIVAVFIKSVLCGHLEAIRLVHLYHTTRIYWNYALVLATRLNYAKIVRYLTEIGTRLEKDEFLALTIAKELGHKEIAEYLEKKKYDYEHPCIMALV
jgi:hypothetical protein